MAVCCGGRGFRFSPPGRFACPGFSPDLFVCAISISRYAAAGRVRPGSIM